MSLTERRFTLRMPENLYVRMQKQADARLMSHTAYVREAVIEKLKRDEPEVEVRRRK